MSTRTVQLRVELKDGSTEEMDLSFDERDDARLRQFRANYERFSSTPFIKNSIPRLTNIRWTWEDGMQFTVTDFDYDDLCAFLHVARPIFLEEEPASFMNTAAVLGRRGKHTGLRRHLKHLHGVYRRGPYLPYFQVRVNNVPIFEESTALEWLNGVEYHQQSDRPQRVKELEAALGEDVARGLFICQLTGRIEATSMLAYLVDLALDTKSVEDPASTVGVVPRAADTPEGES